MGLMSIAKSAATLLAVLVEPHPTPTPSWMEEEENARWDGPDDLWPEEPATTDAETLTALQYGLRLPNGETAWGSWSGVSFDQPLDRLRMIAKLQRAAQDCGWQIDEFVGRYAWVAREQHAVVHYEDAGEYDIHDPDIVTVVPSENSQPGQEGE